MNVSQISDAEGAPDAGDYHIDVVSDFEEYSGKKDSCDKSTPYNRYRGMVSLYLSSCAPAQDFLFFIQITINQKNLLMKINGLLIYWKIFLLKILFICFLQDSKILKY